MVKGETFFVVNYHRAMVLMYSRNDAGDQTW